MNQSSKLLADLQPIDYSGRPQKVRNVLSEDLDGLIISHLTNVRYLTGFTGSNGLVYLTRDSIVFITDGRYKTQSAQELGSAGIDAEIFVTSQGEGPLNFLEKKFSKNLRIGLESDTLSWAGANSYIDKFVDNSFVPTSGIVESVRMVKESSEVDRIRAACRIADDALAQTLPMLKEFPSEKEFARALDRKMVDLGAQGNSFDTITACGPRGALPHAQPSDAKIAPNQMIVIDFGCIVEGYCSDMTRTVSVGQPDEKQTEMFEQVIQSQSDGRKVVKAGVKLSEIDVACRETLAGFGVDQYFTHSTGHGVGLDIHERPWVRAAGQDSTQAGHILTVEPGIYIEGIAGVRIEDTLHVTEAGSEVLTTAPKQLVL